MTVTVRPLTLALGLALLVTSSKGLSVIVLAHTTQIDAVPLLAAVLCASTISVSFGERG